VRVESFTLSLDGYGAGPAQSLEQPLGVGGEALLEGLDLPALGYRCVDFVPSEAVTHVVIRKEDPEDG